MKIDHVGINIGYNAHAAETLERGHGIQPCDVRSLAGKTVLALGSGVQRWEDTYLSQFEGLDIQVVNIDPIYKNWKCFRDKEMSGVRTGSMAAGIGQALPLRDGSVRAVFSSWSVPLAFSDESATLASARVPIDALASELWRVLEPGGTFSLEPLFDMRDRQHTKDGADQNALDGFTAAGFSCRVVPFVFEHDNQAHDLSRLEGVKQI